MITPNANGANIPALGLGTYDLRGDTCIEMIQQALTHGYQHIDTAAFYENEEAIGEGIRASGIARDKIFLTTKVWPSEVEDGKFQRSVEASLKRLDQDHVDLLLIHWPPHQHDVRGWAKLLNDTVERGWARNIGVSNFTSSLLDGIVEVSDRLIAVNQVENHPYLDQAKVRATCKKHGVALVAYCPLFKARELFSEQIIRQCVGKYDKDPAQIILRWHIQHDGAGAIPKTATVSRMKTNIDIFDFELSSEEMEGISALTGNNIRICDDPNFSPQWDSV